MKSRSDLIDYLCSQQHSAVLLATASSGGPQEHGRPWTSLPPAVRDADRAGMRALLSELEDLGLLVSSRVPA
jgi:hypothetical protein